MSNSNTDLHGSSDDLGNPWKRMMARHDREIGADEYRFLADPEAWFIKLTMTELKITEEEAMKLKDIFGGIVALFKPAVNKFEDGKKEKNVTKMLDGIGDIVEIAARGVETISVAAKAAGEAIPSAEKRNMAVNAAASIVTGGVNKAVDIPGLSEDQEEGFFGTLFVGLLGWLVDRRVKKLNEKGWNL